MTELPPVDVVEMSLGELLASLADYNPRQISDRAKAGLRHSIEEFGLVQPIVWNRQTGNVVGGHQRLGVLDEMGQGHDSPVATFVVDLPPAREQALNVALNHRGIQGEFDHDALGTLLQEIEEGGGDELFTGLLLDEFDYTPPDEVDWGGALGDLPSGEQSPIRTMSFTLHVDQLERVKAALALAHTQGDYPDTGNTNRNGNGLARIVEEWMETHGG